MKGIVTRFFVNTRYFPIWFSAGLVRFVSKISRDFKEVHSFIIYIYNDLQSKFLECRAYIPGVSKKSIGV